VPPATASMVTRSTTMRSFHKSGQSPTAVVVGLFQGLHAHTAERLEIFWPTTSTSTEELLPRPSEVIEATRTGVEDYLASGGALLDVHSSATSMTTMSPTISRGLRRSWPRHRLVRQRWTRRTSAPVGPVASRRPLAEGEPPQSGRQTTEVTASPWSERTVRPVGRAQRRQRPAALFNQGSETYAGTGRRRAFGLRGAHSGRPPSPRQGPDRGLRCFSRFSWRSFWWPWSWWG
jgi:hypothetical protein